MTASPDEHQPERPALPVNGSGCSGDDEEWADCLTAEEIAELTRRDWDAVDTDDPAWAEDPEFGSPEWLPDSVAEQDLADDFRPLAPEAIAAGFTHSVGGRGTGFAAGGPLDVQLPGGDLGWHLGYAARRPLGEYSDDELFGFLGANERQVSFHQAATCKIAAELDRRRACAHGSPGQHVDAELAAALTKTRWSAQALLDLARDLIRLPKTLDLLSAGIIDLPRAKVIARHTAVLSDANAAKVEDIILPKAGGMTTGELSSACLRAVIKADPDAARKRKDKALQDARVEAWLEDSGTAAIAGRDLPPADVLAADKHIDALARWLKTQGAEGTLEQLRAQVYLALLNSQPIETLLPAPRTTSQAGNGQASSAQTPDPATTSAGASATSPATGLAGTVHLVMPYDTWAGRSDSPGDIAGYGAADADTCRDLATRMTASPATRWCITVTDRNGRPAAHGCARTGPSPPHTSGDPDTWLATVTIHPIETADCQHRRESAGYQPSPTLRHLVKTRSPRCGFPGCRQPATRCDDDHTLAYHLGGRTCECNLYPLCRKHHQTKQTPGWHLTQPHPGHLTWTAPSGRTYTKINEPYPV